MSGKPGRQKIIEQLLADGMDHMFGNPGTVEQGFLDALAGYPEMKYILTLQESVAVLTADGYARATQKPTLVQLHSAPGIGNAVGALYQAMRGHSPLVVIAGDAGLQYMNLDAQMAADLVAIMEPVTKYATMVLDHRSLLRTLRRAIKIAATPPMGPVYICLPADILDKINEESVIPTSIPSTRILPDKETIEQAARIMVEAKQPMIFAGDGVAYSGANEQLTEVAELLGAQVYGAEVGEVIMDTTHPLFRGTTGHMFGSFSKPIVGQGDGILVVGTYMLPEVFPELGEVYNDKAKVIHFDLNSYEIAKNHRVDLGVVCDPKASLSALAAAIRKLQKKTHTSDAAARTEASRVEKNEAREKMLAVDASFDGTTPLKMAQFAKVLAAKVPEDTVVFDEALTSSPELNRYLSPRLPGSCFTTRGGSLGIGIPGALGAKLAAPEKTVIGFTGDGGAMYTIQALWSAARHNTGAKFVICNNGAYHLLQLNIDVYWKEVGINPHDFPICFDLSEPAIRFADLAEAMGVKAMRVEKPEEIEPAVDAMLADDKPFLVDLVLAGNSHPELIAAACNQGH